MRAVWKWSSCSVERQLFIQQGGLIGHGDWVRVSEGIWLSETCWQFFKTPFTFIIIWTCSFINWVTLLIMIICAHIAYNAYHCPYFAEFWVWKCFLSSCTSRYFVFSIRLLRKMYLQLQIHSCFNHRSPGRLLNCLTTASCSPRHTNINTHFHLQLGSLSLAEETVVCLLMMWYRYFSQTHLFVQASQCDQAAIQTQVTKLFIHTTKCISALKGRLFLWFFLFTFAEWFMYI